MNKLKVRYPLPEDHTNLSEADIETLRKVEPEVLKALPTLFCVMVDAIWIYLPCHTGKYFGLFANTNPRKHIGDFGLKNLDKQSREAFYEKLEKLSFTAPDFKPVKPKP